MSRMQVSIGIRRCGPLALLLRGEKMTKYLLVFVFALALIGPVSGAQTKGWRGIVPLHSTREDVERLIGAPMTPNGITYDLNDERVNVVYSDGSVCERGAQWRAPRGTVIGITAYLKQQRPLAEFPIDPTKFEKFTHPDRVSVSYNNPEDGISFGTTLEGEVFVIEYYPAAKDKDLRCPKLPLSNDELRYYIFDYYSGLSLSDERARLDNFGSELQRKPKLKGYILVYAPRNTPSRKVLARARRARDYLLRKWRLDATRVELRNAGYRKKVTTELYLVASGN